MTAPNKHTHQSRARSEALGAEEAAKPAQQESSAPSVSKVGRLLRSQSLAPCAALIGLPQRVRATVLTPARRPTTIPLAAGPGQVGRE
jgi:hypothetical protein